MKEKRCANCKSENFIEVDITTRGAFTLVPKSNKCKIMPVSSQIKKYLCLDCGYISLYAENKDFIK